MQRIPRPVLRALEALAQSPINTSALVMTEGQDFAHDTLCPALGQPLAFFFELSLKLCRDLGGLEQGYLILDDVLIGRYRSGRLGLRAFPGGPGLDGREAADSLGLPALLRGRREQAGPGPGPAGVGQGGGLSSRGSAL